MSGRGTGGKGGRGGRGKGRGRKVQRVETDEERETREARELVEAKKHQLIEFVKKHPVLYDLSHPDHLNAQITRVLWEEIADELDVDGNNLFAIICRNNLHLQ